MKAIMQPLIGASPESIFGGVEATPVVLTKVVAAGDSITEDTSSFEGTWVDDAGAYTPEIEWINSGVASDTSTQLWARWQTDVVDHDPDAVVILIGVNDIGSGSTAQDVIDNITLMLDSSETNGIIVYLCTITPWKGWGSWTAPRQVETDDLNAWILTQGAANVNIIDLYSQFEDDSTPDTMEPVYSFDWLHPSYEGSHMASRMILDILKPAYEDAKVLADYTTWTELDPNSKYTVSATEVDAAAGYQAGTDPGYIAASISGAIPDSYSMEFTASVKVTSNVHQITMDFCEALGEFDAADDGIILYYFNGEWQFQETYSGALNVEVFADASAITEDRIVEFQVYEGRFIYCIYDGADKDVKGAILFAGQRDLDVGRADYQYIMMCQTIGINQPAAFEKASNFKTTIPLVP